MRRIWLVALLALMGEVRAVSPEKRLAALQVEEVALLQRYREAHPKVREVRAEIASLESAPGMINERYHAALKGAGEVLAAERERMLKNHREANPSVAMLDAQLAFIRETLKSVPPPS